MLPHFTCLLRKRWTSPMAYK